MCSEEDMDLLYYMPMLCVLCFSSLIDGEVPQLLQIIKIYWKNAQLGKIILFENNEDEKSKEYFVRL